MCLKSDFLVRLLKKLEVIPNNIGMSNVSIIPLMHPITTSLIKESIKGDGPKNNNLGFAPLNQRSHYFFTHITK